MSLLGWVRDCWVIMLFLPDYHFDLIRLFIFSSYVLCMWVLFCLEVQGVWRNILSIGQHVDSLFTSKIIIKSSIDSLSLSLMLNPLSASVSLSLSHPCFGLCLWGGEPSISPIDSISLFNAEPSLFLSLALDYACGVDNQNQNQIFSWLSLSPPLSLSLMLNPLLLALLLSLSLSLMPNPPLSLWITVVG